MQNDSYHLFRTILLWKWKEITPLWKAFVNTQKCCPTDLNPNQLPILKRFTFRLRTRMNWEFLHSNFPRSLPITEIPKNDLSQCSIISCYCHKLLPYLTAMGFPCGDRHRQQGAPDGGWVGAMSSEDALDASPLGRSCAAQTEELREQLKELVKSIY